MMSRGKRRSNSLRAIGRHLVGVGKRVFLGKFLYAGFDGFRFPR